MCCLAMLQLAELPRAKCRIHPPLLGLNSDRPGFKGLSFCICCGVYCICLHGKWDVTGGHTNFISLLYEAVVYSSVLQMYLKIGSLSCQKHTSVPE